MIKGILPVFLLTALFFIYHSSSGQNRCGTVEYSKKLSLENPLQFENWITNQISRQKNGRTLRTQAGPYTVPVVVHVIHNGEALGSGTNIPDAQILSQIKVLNQDFNRLNADASETPAQFVSVAGSMNIEFVLAKQDPEGLATNGIVRVNGNRTSWTSHDNYELKAKSYWPSDKYLNIWVCNITDYLGYTQFPVSTLPGLENGSNNAETDGIVVWYRSFGSVLDGSFSLDPEYNLGRTLTHEMGHFFGLNHIWGDDSGTCSGSDYVDDTPNQGSSTTNCPTHPAADNCTTAKMFQNFLDYTDDTCMNLFTNGQVSRMSIVIENSPRRVSLLTSPGLQDPTPVANDLGIYQILSPEQSSCGTLITPQIELKNYGTNQVTTTRIQLTINGAVVETKNVSVNLGYLQSVVVTFNAVTIVAGANTFSFDILQTNGVTDSNVHVNSGSITTVTPQTIPVPFSETFASLPPKWTIQNPDQQITWQVVTAPKETSDNKALSLDFFNYEDSYGEVDVFLSPVFDLSTAPVASLMFDVAHATYQGTHDQLKIVVLTNCEALADGTTVYNKSGSSLATVPSSTQLFVPKDQTQWRREIVNLNSFVGQSNVQIAFVGVNDWGNNLYLDNISFFITKLEDVALKTVVRPSVVTCDDSPSPQIVVQNLGTVTITNFKVNYSVNNGTVQSYSATNLNLLSGEEVTLSLPPVSLEGGNNTLFINIVEPNGVTDQTPANNQNTFLVAVNKTVDRIPLRENFDNPYQDRWTIINPAVGGSNWQEKQTNFNTSIYFDSFTNTATGTQSWLVSPVLDFSKTSAASLVFDLSYALRGNRLEELKIYSSVDCGNSYSEFTDIPLSNFPSSSSAWTPQGETDWTLDNIINLSSLAGQEQVRIAFVVTNGNGNNIYLDNIEFFTTTSPNTIQLTEPFSIYGYNIEQPESTDLQITFNLSKRQDVEYTIVDMMGKSLAVGILTDVLNQTFPLEMVDNVTSGIYIVRLRMENRYFSQKILISN